MLIEASGAFGMHLIDETQIELAWRFGLQSGHDIDKLADLSFHTAETGSPLLYERGECSRRLNHLQQNGQSDRKLTLLLPTCHFGATFVVPVIHNQ